MDTAKSLQNEGGSSWGPIIDVHRYSVHGRTDNISNVTDVDLIGRFSQDHDSNTDSRTIQSMGTTLKR